MKEMDIMDETLTKVTGTASHSRATRSHALLAGVLAAAMLAVPMLVHADSATAPASIVFGAAPVPAVEGDNTIPLDELGDFVVDDLNAYWTQSFANAGLEYVPTSIVYFEFGVESGCGLEAAEGGPFYCPSDFLVYLPSEFFVGDIRSQDFAVAAVIAHEVGHHVQNLVGISDAAALGQITSVQQELQADCLAGVWTADIEARGLTEAGDYEEAIVLFDSIGDDALGVPAGEETHGHSDQRVGWFEYGYSVADGSLCLTY
jgi:predicted metalloprotease